MAWRTIIGIANDDNVALRVLLSPVLSPQVEGIVEKYIRQERGDHRALRCTHRRLRPRPVVGNPCPEPLSDQSQDPAICDPVPEELQQPLVVDGVKETTNVRIEHPVYLPLLQTHPQSIQCVVRITARPKSIAEADKILLIDLFEHGLDGLLDDLVLQGRNAQGTLPS